MYDFPLLGNLHLPTVFFDNYKEAPGFLVLQITASIDLKVFVVNHRMVILNDSFHRLMKSNAFCTKTEKKNRYKSSLKLNLEQHKEKVLLNPTRFNQDPCLRFNLI